MKNRLFRISIFLFISGLILPAFGAGEEIGALQKFMQGRTTGERIAFWAEHFIGRPYDPDPQGLYVTRSVIVADEEMDCMYLTFRAVELAMSRTPEEAIQVALDKRFHSRGVLQDGKVVNYQDRFEYGEDMIESGKWGKEITSQLGRTARIRGSRGREFYEVLSPHEIARRMGRLRTGDLLFFFKIPEKRVSGEGVGHMGFVKVESRDEERRVFLIHAGGVKNKGGAVRKVSLPEYLDKMSFVGVKVTRFE